MLNLRKLMNCKLKEIGILSNSLREWWPMNLQPNVEAWEAEDSKDHNLQLEKMEWKVVETAKMKLDLLSLKVETLQIMEERDEINTDT